MRRAVKEVVVVWIMWLQMLGHALLDTSERVLDSDAFAAYVLVIGMAVGGFLVGYGMAVNP